MLKGRLFIASLLLCLGGAFSAKAQSVPCPISNVVYVDSAATGANDGSSWANAFRLLDSAIVVAHRCTTVDSILVAKGTYFPSITPPNTSTDRDKCFYFLRDSLAVLGGYPSGGGIRDYKTHSTVLNGDIGVLGDSTDNAYHVVLTVGVGSDPIDSTLVIDGFSITRGNADLSTVVYIVWSEGIIHHNGGGMYNHHSSPTLKNIDLSANNAIFGGGGMYNYISSLELTNVIISGNSADRGGGMYNQNSNPTLTNVTISSNRAGSDGGGIHNQHSSPELTNVGISGNSAGGNGGGIFNESSSSPLLTNVTMSGNSAVGGNGGGMMNIVSSKPQIINSIIYGNSSSIYQGDTNSAAIISYSMVEDSMNTDDGNIASVDPLFVHAPSYTSAPFTGGDYRLRFCSPVLDIGGSHLVPVGASVDLVGNPRFYNVSVDMGAYEKQSRISDIEVAVALGDTASNAIAFMPTCEDGEGWTWYASTKNPDSVSFAIRWGTANNSAKEAAKIYLTVDASHHISTNGIDSGIIAMKRYWNVDIGGAKIVAPVSVRFFFDDADTSDMYAQIGTALPGVSPSLIWLKTVGSPYRTSVVTYKDINGGKYAGLSPIYGKANGVSYAQFDGLMSLDGGTVVLSSDRKLKARELSEGSLAYALFPNPTKGAFSIDIQGMPEAKGVLDIYDILGRMVYRTAIVNGRNDISPEGLSKGVYQLRFGTEGYLYSDKLVVE